MPEQRLSTTLQLDAVLGGGYKKAFSAASDLMADLKAESTALKAELKKIGREADELENVGKASKDLRDEMKLLQRQINESTRAVEKFSESRRHFRKASIGARALKSDIAEIANTAKTATLAIGAIGAGVTTVALSPGEELLDFDQTLAGIAAISPEVDDSGIQMLREDIRALSNETGIATNEVASHFLQLTRNMGVDAAGETITAALDFQVATGTSIEEIKDELATAKIALGIDTPAETREFFGLLARAHKEGMELGNLDFGDMETLRARTGEDIFGENFQREFLTTIAFRQVDSFEFADHAQAFQEEFARSTVPTPQMEIKDIKKSQENLLTLQRYGLRAEDGILGAMQAFQALDAQRQSAFREDISPILGEHTVEVIARGSEALSQVTQQVDAALDSEQTLSETARQVTSSWSAQWTLAGRRAKNALGLVQEAFGEAFAPVLLKNVTRLGDFLSRHQDQIRNFFTGLRDGITPIVSRVYNTIRLAWPDIKQFAMDVWGELRAQWQAIAPAGRAVWDVVWGITKAVGGFLKEHPRLVATVLTGIAAWKAYKLAASGVQVVGDVVRGATSLARGHLHRLNAMILQNQRVTGVFSSASKGMGTVISGIGRSALAAIPGIAAMGGSLMAAILPALPVILPVVGAVAALGAAGVLIYRNWEPIKAFFVDNFSTIRNVLMLVFPPLGMIAGVAGVIKENWAGIKEMFSTVFESVRMAAKVAFAFVEFVALSALVALKRAWGGITGFFKDVWASVTGVFTQSPLTPIFNAMVGGIKAVVSPLRDFFSDFWGNISQKAGEVIGWITGKFESLNKILNTVFGWLRDSNAELREELNITSEVKGVSRVDIPPVEVPGTPTRETPTQEMRMTPPGEFIQQNVPAPVQTPIETSKPQIDSSSPGEFIQQNVPVTTSPQRQKQTRIDISKQQVTVAAPEQSLQQNIPATSQLHPRFSRESEFPPTPTPTTSQDEMLNVGLGILAENRKQTLLLQEMLDTRKLSDTVTVWDTSEKLGQVEVPQIEMPAKVDPDMSETSRSTFLDIGKAPVLQEAPALEFHDYTLPSAPAGTPAPERLQEGDVTEQNTTAPVTISNHFTIVQEPGQDTEAFAQRVAEIVMRQMDEAHETYLVQ